MQYPLFTIDRDWQPRCCKCGEAYKARAIAVVHYPGYSLLPCCLGGCNVIPMSDEALMPLAQQVAEENPSCIGLTVMHMYEDGQAVPSGSFYGPEFVGECDCD